MDLTTEERLTIEYYDKSASLWAKKRTGEFWNHEIDHLHELLPAGKLLEVGCGIGIEAQALAAKRYDYTGIDASFGMLRLARQRAPELDFRLMNALELEFENESFDGFWTAATLLHIPKSKTSQALGELARVTRIGGVGCIGVKQGQGEGVETQVSYGAKNTRFFAYFEEHELVTALTAVGFNILETHQRSTSNTTWITVYVSKL